MASWTHLHFESMAWTSPSWNILKLRQAAYFKQHKSYELLSSSKVGKLNYILTIIASISLLETGVRFGWREAFPPTAVFAGAAGTSELDLALRFWFDADWVCETEPIHRQSRFFKMIMNMKHDLSRTENIKQEINRVQPYKIVTDTQLSLLTFKIVKICVIWMKPAISTYSCFLVWDTMYTKQFQEIKSSG